MQFMPKSKELTNNLMHTRDRRAINSIKSIVVKLSTQIYSIMTNNTLSDVNIETLPLFSTQFHTLIIFNHVIRELKDKNTVTEILLCCFFLSLKINNINVPFETYKEITTIVSRTKLELEICKIINYKFNISSVAEILFSITTNKNTFEKTLNALSETSANKINFIDEGTITINEFVLSLLEESELNEYEKIKAVFINRERLNEVRKELNE
ncbi:hypothetical protein NUSPORA_01204 [Nucleospora cyclopteri]